jgi:CheY-like chemotaxis protein
MLNQELIVNQTVSAAEERGPRILIVEDNAINQQVTVKILGKYGCKTQVVANGREAVDALRRYTYDAVLMDLQMPVMDGFEATKAIRDPSGDCLNPQVPIIALTANAQEETRKKCLDAGMDGFLTKPVSPDALMCKIRQSVEKFNDKRPACDLKKCAL